MKTLLLTLILATITNASSITLATEIFEEWNSARAQGMGNAYSAVVDNYEALFFNPAALDKIQGVHFTALSPTIATDALTAYTTFQNATGSNYSAIINQYFGQEIMVGVEDQLSLSMRDFAFGGYDAFNLAFNLNNPPYANLNLRVTNDEGMAVGFAQSLLPQDALRVGFTFKRITRYGGDVSFGPSTLATLSNAQLTALMSNIGTGYGVDFGSLIELPVPSHLAFSFVWKDIGQTTFLATAGSTAPPINDNDLIFGISMNYDFGAVKLRPAAEFSEITMWDEEIGKRLHLGAELVFPGFSIRGGINQGYLTYGFGLDFQYLRIDAASYGVELDTYPGQLVDQRYVINVTLDFNFDLRSGSSGKNGGANGGLGGGANGSGGYVSPSYQRR